MKYLSVKEAAEKWGISGAMVRRYCVQNRIPRAVQTDSGWKIPENAKKPKAKNEPREEKQELSPLAQKILRQKTKKGYHGLYDYIQVNLTYSSCRMASCRLTREQVEHIFKKGKVKDMFESIKISDVIEVMNHCFCVDYILDQIQKPITIAEIQKLHTMLVSGTVDAQLDKVRPGEFRKSDSLRNAAFIGDAEVINAALKELCKEYENKPGKGLDDVLEFHVRFERIFPFDDYNGRVGRLLLFKECLRQNVPPFILDDKKRSRYLNGLREWDDDPTILTDVIAEAQDRFVRQVVLQELLEQSKHFAPEGTN